jgi:iron(III) transport system ATP-binding protein
LDGFDLRCEPAEITAILGRSGCGKSTILDLIAGLRPPHGGAIKLSRAGQSIQPTIGFIFQRDNCLPWLTIEKNLLFGLDEAEEAGADVGSLAARLNISHLLQRFPRELSGGEQQRVAVGRLLLRRPDLVLCDEPWSSLDIGARRSVETLVRELIHSTRATAVLVTHEPREALRVADRVVVLSCTPIRIVHEIRVAPSMRTDPLALETFTRDYLDILSAPTDEDERRFRTLEPSPA